MNSYFYRLFDEFDLGLDPGLPFPKATAGKDYVATVELPGTPKADIKVKLVPETRRMDVSVKDKVVAKFLVPRGFSLGALTSEYKDGLLTITSPKDPATEVEITVQ